MDKVEKKRFIAFMVPLALTLAIIVCFSIAIARKHSELKTVLARNAVLEKEVTLLKKKNLELHTLRDALVYDPVQVEKEAREQLGYGKPKEKVYKKRNFRIVENADDAGPAHEAGYTGKEGGILNSIGLFGTFILIIVSVTGVFYGTYWYEHKYGKIRS
ncbi:MAG: septum formation initiator family protein [Candidatus Brocadiales bacterium]|nr:septum formation initiator family protein [Candidatus Bathyanammoxibius amoris]